MRVRPTPLVASGTHAPLVPTLARVDQMPVFRSARSCSVTAFAVEPTRFTAPRVLRGSRLSVFAVPVPVPTAVAVKMVPALLLGAPNNDQLVVPGVLMTYAVPTTRAVALTNPPRAPPMMLPLPETVDCTRISSARVPAGEPGGTAPTSNSSETELLALSPTKSLTPSLVTPRPSVPPRFQFATRYSKITIPLVNGVLRVAVRIASPVVPPCPPLLVLFGFHLKLAVSPILSTPPCVAMPPPDQLSSVPVRLATVLVPKL